MQIRSWQEVAMSKGKFGPCDEIVPIIRGSGQYRNPKAHRGIFLNIPASISSAATYPFSASFI